MKIPIAILEMLQKKSGLQLNQPSDCEILGLCIEQETGAHLGVNTLKRLFGILPAETMPRMSTLNILASYLNVRDWATLMESLESQNSSFQLIEGETFSQDLKDGALVKVTYAPDRELLFQKIRGTLFRVISSKGSRLQVDDVLDVDCFIPGFPLIVKEVKRGKESLGRYTAGLKSGLESIKLSKT